MKKAEVWIYCLFAIQDLNDGNTDASLAYWILDLMAWNLHEVLK